MSIETVQQHTETSAASKLQVRIVIGICFCAVCYHSLLHYAVPTKMQITFPVSPRQNTEEYGSCIVSAWPRPPENETTVYSSDTSCAIKILSVRHTDTYTTAVYFKMYANSSCRSIFCDAPSKQRKKSINTCRC